MNLPLRVGYEGAALLARALASVAPASGGKLLRSFAARRGVRDRFAAFVRRPGRPLLWMHAPSRRRGAAGAPGARAGARAADRDAQLAYTYFSPSAERFAQRARRRLPRLPAVRHATATRVRRSTRSRPTALVFSKLDVWPALAREASSARRAAGPDQRDARARARRAGAASPRRCCATRTRGWTSGRRDQRRRRRAAGRHSACRPTRISVTGDTRYDQVWARAAAARLALRRCSRRSAADGRRSLPARPGRRTSGRCSARGAASASGIPTRG